MLFRSRAQGIAVALKIGNKHLNRALGQGLTQSPNDRRKLGRAAIDQIVARHRGDNHMPEAKGYSGLSHALRLGGVGGSGLAGVDYSVRCFPDSSVPGCCPSRCRFPYRFRYRCSGASPALPMPSGMSCALRTWLLLPGCDPACLSVLWVPGAGCPPLACLLSGGGRRLPWFFARAGRCVFRAGEPWDPG